MWVQSPASRGLIVLAPSMDDSHVVEGYWPYRVMGPKQDKISRYLKYISIYPVLNIKSTQFWQVLTSMSADNLKVKSTVT